MKTLSAKILSIMLLLVVTLPLVAMAEEAAPEFKGKNAPLDSWLTISGDYRMRVDSLRGDTAAYVDANKTFANAQNILQSNFFNSAVVIDPATGATIFAAGTPAAAAFWQGQIGGFMSFSNAMKQATTFNSAQAFLGLPTTQQMLGGLQNFGVMIPAEKVKNDTMYTNRLG